MSFKDSMPIYQARIEAKLEHWLPAASKHPARLHEAMRYAVMGGGKRLRPMLVYATGEVLGIDAKRLDGPATALEIVHAYSLIHDDLPAMDDDNLRRGQPTCHIAFDEATAILAGDALQCLAFEVLVHDPDMTPNANARLKIIEQLAVASGSRGMAGGQAMDMAAMGNKLDVAQIEDMHIHKTGALIRASILMTTESADSVSTTEREALDKYARCLGLAYQIHDDILDEESDTQTLGKTSGADSAMNKPTYPAIVGLKDAKLRAVELRDDAIHALSCFEGRAEPLIWLAHHVVDRSH